MSLGDLELDEVLHGESFRLWVDGERPTARPWRRQRRGSRLAATLGNDWFLGREQVGARSGAANVMEFTYRGLRFIYLLTS